MLREMPSRYLSGKVNNNCIVVPMSLKVRGEGETTQEQTSDAREGRMLRTQLQNHPALKRHAGQEGPAQTERDQPRVNQVNGEGLVSHKLTEVVSREEGLSLWNVAEIKQLMSKKGSWIWPLGGHGQLNKSNPKGQFQKEAPSMETRSGREGGR